MKNTIVADIKEQNLMVKGMDMGLFIIAKEENT